MDLVDRLADPLGQPELRGGFAAGAVALFASAILGLLWRVRNGLPAPVGGLAVAGATLMALGDVLDVPQRLVVGVGAVAAAGALHDLLRAPLWVAGLASAPGAYLVTTSAGVADRGAIATLVFATAVVGGTGVAAFDDRWRRTALAPTLLLVTAGGAYSTLPDTETALVLLGVLVVVAFAAWPARLVRLGGAGSFAATAVLAWAIAVGGTGRDGSVVGAAACLSLLIIDPCATSLIAATRRWRSSASVDVGVPGVVITVAVHIVVALYMARVAGLQEELGAASARAALGFVVALGTWTAVRIRLTAAADVRDVASAAPGTGR